MNFYKRHIGDYIKDAAHLTLLEHGVYTRLMDVYYTRESAIPDGQAARLIGARTKDEVKAVEAVLAEFFTLVDGHWRQERCEREIEEASAQAEKNRANGKKGGRPPKKRTEEEPNENPVGFVSDNPVGSVSDSQKNLSQTPDTISQTPDIKPSAAAGVIAEPAPAHSEPPSAAAQIAMTLIGWERARGKVTRGISASNAQVMDLAAQKPTPDELRKAYDLAVADREATGDPSPVNAGFLLVLLAKVRNPPKPRPSPAAAWWSTNDTMLAKARELGISDAYPGEEPHAFRSRIQQAIDAQQRRAAA